MRRTIKFLSEAIDRTIMTIFVLMMLFGLYALYDSYSLYLNAQDKGLLAYKPKQDTVYEEVPLEGYVAWLTIDDTAIDYPVMQGIDNDEYLNKDPYGNYSLSGSIFLDFRNNPEFTDKYSLVYGHHMGHGAMFGALDEYRDKEFYKTHRKGTLIVGGKSYTIQLFAVMEPMADDSIIFDPSESEGIEAYIKANALYYNEPERGNLIALSTCSGDGSMERLVVFGTLIP